MARHVERPRPGRGLSVKILGLAVVFLLVGEVLIFVPSIARFRLTYLEEVIGQAHLATLVAKESGEMPISPRLQRQLLGYLRADAVILWQPDAEVMLGEMETVEPLYDLRDVSAATLVLDAFTTMLTRGPRTIRVIGTSPYEPAVTVDVSLAEAPLRRAMLAYAVRVLALSLLLSAIMASLLLLSLRRMIIVPLAVVTERLLAFRERPEDVALDWEVSGRRDEIGIVERELAGMQRRLREALLQKTRLAALGEAVGRVSHELRNMLASAVLISDRLEGSADPAVRTVAPRLVATLERAVRLCARSLDFAREQPAPPRLTRFGLAALVEEVHAELLPADSEIAWENRVPPDLEVTADRDQLYRVLANLGRNSREALAGAPGRITSDAARIDGWVRVRVGDTGPGIHRQVLPRLFETFSGSTKPDGSGLGLAICREIMRAHGGEIRLVRTGPDGTEFELDLPDRPDVPAGGPGAAGRLSGDGLGDPTLEVDGGDAQPSRKAASRIFQIRSVK